MSDAGDRFFGRSISEIYNRHLVPLMFEPYAEDLAARIPPGVARLLEVAAGTGAVTRAIARSTPASVNIVATDLNPAMLAEAKAQPIARPVEWREADALALPFGDDEFDAVLCQFGVMFFPDRVRAFSEVHRVLRDRGTFLFNVWGRLEDNEFANVVTESLAAMLPSNAPPFMHRVPHGYFDPDVIRDELAAGGFTATPSIETVVRQGRGNDARTVAVAFCQGTPLRNELDARGLPIDEATAVATDAIAHAFGRGPVEGKLQALVIEVHK